ncbi:MAG: 50S ribosomal protein L25, partial [Bacteroidetes bacterium]|nr:50S ribosomal protein L25 [Bacteroidota bacterium]
LHIDFLLVTDESPVSIRIPVLTNGFALGVQDGGKLKVEMRRLKVKALPRYLPDSLDIDVTDIELGQSVKVRELDFENMELLDPRNSVVVSVKLTRVAKGMAAADEEEEEEIEGEEGEESGEEASDSE